MKRITTLLALFALVACPLAIHAAPTLPVPAPATARLGAPAIVVEPDRADWTYALGQPARFRVRVLVDQQPVAGSVVRYEVGPEKFPAPAREATVPAEGLVIDGGTLQQPGFIRCIVTTEANGKTYRGLATAGFAPEKITPTQTEPADFDAFWAAGKAALAKIPVDARLTLLPDSSTSEVNVYHVSFRTAGNEGSRIYGILCEPIAPGRYPAILRVPGAGVRPYSGAKDLAARGAIVLEIGIHGIPVNLAQELYDQLRVGALAGYHSYNLDDKESYYYRRVYLGCVRANDFLVSRPMWDGKNLITMGGSQGGQLTIVTAALDSRVTAAAANYPAYCDVTGYLHNRAGGWPHMMTNEAHRTPAKIATTAYYDAVNFARRVKVPIHFAWGYNDEVCPVTSMYAAYNLVTAPKELVLVPQMGHSPIPELTTLMNEWVLAKAGVVAP